MVTAGTIYAWQFECDGQALDVKVEGPLTFNEPELMLQAALDGLGVAYLLAHEVAPHLEAGRLLQRLPEWTPPFPGFHLYYSSRRQMRPVLAAFIASIYWLAIFVAPVFPGTAFGDPEFAATNPAPMGVPLQLLIGIGECRLSSGELSLALVDHSFEWLALDRKDHLAFFDVVAFLKEARPEKTLHASPQVNLFKRLRAPDILGLLGQGAQLAGFVVRRSACRAHVASPCAPRSRCATG